MSISIGELVALMGPSGCGKTTLLNVLARRPAASGAKVLGDCYVNGTKVDVGSFGRMTSYVEQEDALIGSLTVRETLKFAGDLSLPRYVLVFFSAYYQIPLPCQRVLIQSPLVM
jgi:ABC-type multidrug transport system ATPase subunit